MEKLKFSRKWNPNIHPQADGHVGVAGEIVVELEDAHRAKPPKGHRGGRAAAEGGVRHHGKLIESSDLFPQSHKKAGHTRGEVRPGLSPPVDPSAIVVYRTMGPAMSWGRGKGGHRAPTLKGER